MQREAFKREIADIWQYNHGINTFQKSTIILPIISKLFLFDFFENILEAELQFEIN